METGTIFIPGKSTLSAEIVKNINASGAAGKTINNAVCFRTLLLNVLTRLIHVGGEVGTTSR